MAETIVRLTPRCHHWSHLDRRGLHIAVRDGNPRLLRLVTPDWQAEGGRGLWLVEQLARAWGVHRHPDGGKVVWCVLSL